MTPYCAISVEYKAAVAKRHNGAGASLNAVKHIVRKRIQIVDAFGKISLKPWGCVDQCFDQHADGLLGVRELTAANENKLICHLRRLVG
jgi:hypothetical protein